MRQYSSDTCSIHLTELSQKEKSLKIWKLVARIHVLQSLQNSLLHAVLRFIDMMDGICLDYMLGPLRYTHIEYMYAWMDTGAMSIQL